MTSILRADRLEKRFGNTVALAGVSFEILAGESVALVGPNGAGKSTLMNVICGFLQPTSGNLWITEVPHTRIQGRGLVGALPQDAQFNPSLSVGEQLEFLAKLQGLDGKEAREEAKRVMAAVLLEDSYDARPGSLSHGMAKRVSIAQALINTPPIVVLDEPTAGLDPETARRIRNLLRSLRTQSTLIVSSHNLDELEDLCSRTLFLEAGQLTEFDHGTAQQSAYLTVEMNEPINEQYVAMIRNMTSVLEVTEKNQNALIIRYNFRESPDLDIELIQFLRQQNQTYRSILRGRKLEDHLFGPGRAN